jgi:hypothetical protein
MIFKLKIISSDFSTTSVLAGFWEIDELRKQCLSSKKLFDIVSKFKLTYQL